MKNNDKRDMQCEEFLDGVALRQIDNKQVTTQVIVIYQKKLEDNWCLYIKNTMYYIYH